LTAKTAGAQIVGESRPWSAFSARWMLRPENFKATEASVVWDQYEKVINETETEKGKDLFPA
jgi:hypothetical protein